MIKQYIKRMLLLSLLALASVNAQDPNIPRFVAFKATTLSGAVEVITIQQPATGGKTIRIESVEVWCSVACTVTLEREGTAATGTTLTPTVVTYGTPSANVFHTSDVGVGSVITIKEIPALTITPIVFPGGLNLPPFDSDGDASNFNFSVRTNSITGDVKITIVWRQGR